MGIVKFNTDYFLKWLASYTEVEDVKKQAAKAFKGITPDNMFKKAHQMTAFFDMIVTLVEKSAVDFSTLEGKDEPTGKKKLDVAAEFLDKIIELPFYLEWLDGKVIKYLLSSAVQSLNKHVGEGWVDSGIA